MISVKRGEVRAYGSDSELLTELCGLIRGFREKNVASDERIKHAIEIAFKSDAEIKKEMEEVIEEYIKSDNLKLFLKKILDTGDLDDDN